MLTESRGEFSDLLLKNGKQWTKNAETQQNLNAKKRLATHRCFSLKGAGYPYQVASKEALEPY